MADPPALQIATFDGPNPPLVFLGELGFRADVWRTFGASFAAAHQRLEIDLLAPSAHRVATHPTEERRAAASPAALTQLLHEALVTRRQLGPFVLIGLGFGAVVAEEYAERHADTLLGVVLVNPPHALAHQWRVWLSEGPLERLFAHPHPELVKVLQDARAANPAWRDVEEVLRVEVHNRFDEHRLPLPTLIVAGDAAPLTSLARICDLRRERTQVSVAICNEAGHFPMLEAPEALRAALHHFLGHVRRHTRSAPGAWSYRPTCVWDADAPVQTAGVARAAMEALERNW